MQRNQKGVEAFFLGAVFVAAVGCGQGYQEGYWATPPGEAHPGDKIPGGGTVVEVIAPSEGGCFKPTRDPSWPAETGTEVFIHSMKSDPPVEGWNRYNGHVELVSATVAGGPWLHFKTISGSQAKPDPAKGQWSLEVVCEKAAFPHQQWDTTSASGPTILAVGMKLLIIQGGAPPPTK